MAEIQKGIISTIEGPKDGKGNYTRAKVAPDQYGSALTKPLVIDKPLRGTDGGLKKGTPVIYVVFPDLTGMILCRSDGELPGSK